MLWNSCSGRILDFALGSFPVPCHCFQQEIQMQHASFGNHKKRPFDSNLEFQPPKRQRMGLSYFSPLGASSARMQSLLAQSWQQVARCSRLFPTTMDPATTRSSDYVTAAPSTVLLLCVCVCVCVCMRVFDHLFALFCFASLFWFFCSLVSLLACLVCLLCLFVLFYLLCFFPSPLRVLLPNPWLWPWSWP